jgi:alkylhydroperoxidase family enzyme
MARQAIKYPAVIADLVHAVLHGPGEASVLLRQAAAARAAELSAGAVEAGPLPAGLAPFVDRLAREPGKMRSADVTALRVAGYDEDEIFELAVGVALGAALARLEQGLAALQEAGPCD